MTDPISNERLLPCPFCGGAAHLQEYPPHAHSAPLKALGIPDHDGSWAAECAGCQCGLIFPTKAEAIAAWNRRQSPAGVEPVGDLIRQALRELDNVTAFSDEDANCLGCAENLLRQALASPPPKVVTITDEVAGLERAAKWVEARLTDYVQEHGSYDPGTGTTEFPGNGEEYAYELEEIAEGIRALSSEAHNG